MARPSLPPNTELRRWVHVRRRLDAPPDRVYRAFGDPEELRRWFPEMIDGSLALGTRSILVWPEDRVWWEILETDPDRRFVFRWPWTDDESIVTTVEIDIRPDGYGTRLSLRDGPFSLDEPGAIDAWAESLEGWGEAIAQLRAYVDFSVDLRTRIR